MSKFNKDHLGEKLKKMEREYSTGARYNTKYMIVRIDGNNFSKLTKGLPAMDEFFANTMISTMQSLVETFDAKFGYTQSDEITLVFAKGDKENSTLAFDGRVFKITTLTAAHASVIFSNTYYPKRLRTGIFDSRVYFSDDYEDVIDSIKWRVDDAKRNAVSMYAHRNLNSKALFGQNIGRQKEMLMDAGFDYDNDRAVFSEGTYYYREYVSEPIPEEYKKFHPSKTKIIRTKYELAYVYDEERIAKCFAKKDIY